MLCRRGPIDLDELRARLRKMTDKELIEYGKAGASRDKSPREVFVIQLKEARAEWRRTWLRAA
jgi:transcription initiation factor IIE alpha subunit